MQNVYEVLKSRNLIKDITDPALIDRLNSPITTYCGFDPTGDSLHIGHLLPIIIMKHFENCGHKNIALVGGATGLIGDPSFKKDERSLNSKETVVEYSNKIHDQLVKYLNEDNTTFVNNYDWTCNLNVLDFLRDYGKSFNINYMINKESVKSRLETGLSFTEFTYTILQAMDFNELYQRHNCELQIGGSDQWGNITSGLELIRKENEDAKAYGLTVPLVTKSDGTKFGKTEGGAIWLNPEKTTPYEFYQFFLNSQDEDVINYLKTFTFISLEEIDELEKSLIDNAHLRLPQKALAEALTIFVHGKEALDQVLKISECLFTGDISSLSVEEIETNFTHIKQEQSKSGTMILDFLVEIGLATSKRQAREFVTAGSISIAGEKLTDVEQIITSEMAIGNKYMMVKRGKKKFAFVRLND